MPKEKQSSGATSERKSHLSVGHPAVAPLLADSDRSAQLPAGLVLAVSGDAIQAQVACLGDARLQTAQRQAQAAHLGSLLGNRRLHSIILPIRPANALSGGLPQNVPAPALHKLPATAIARELVEEAERRAGTERAAWTPLPAPDYRAIEDLARSPDTQQAAVRRMWRAIAPGLALIDRVWWSYTPDLGMAHGVQVSPAGAAGGVTLPYVEATSRCPELRRAVAAAEQATGPGAADRLAEAQRAHREHHTHGGPSSAIRVLIQISPTVFHTQPRERVADLHSLLMHEYTHVTQLLARGIHDGTRFMAAGTREYLNEQAVAQPQRRRLETLDEIEACCDEIENAARTGLRGSYAMTHTLDYLWEQYEIYHDSLTDRSGEQFRAVARRVNGAIVSGRNVLVAYLGSSRAGWLPEQLRSAAARHPLGYNERTRRKVDDYL